MCLPSLLLIIFSRTSIYNLILRNQHIPKYQIAKFWKLPAGIRRALRQAVRDHTSDPDPDPRADIGGCCLPTWLGTSDFRVKCQLSVVFQDLSTRSAPPSLEWMDRLIKFEMNQEQKALPAILVPPLLPRWSYSNGPQTTLIALVLFTNQDNHPNLLLCKFNILL